MKNEFKVLFFLIALMLGAEMGVRSFEERLSKDVAHLNTVARLPAELNPRGPGNVLILGNSLSREAFDVTLFEKELHLPDGSPVKMAALYPDASGILDWSQAFRRHILIPGCRPTWVIIGTGRAHLLDPTGGIDLSRLGAWLVPPKERWTFAKEEGLGVEELAPFLLASQFRLFANRHRVQPLAFYNVVPGYEETAQQLNEGRSTVAHTQLLDAPDSAVGHTRHLERLLDDIQSCGAIPIVVAIPLPELYRLPEVVTRLLTARGVRLIDLGSRHALPEEDFPDGYHLSVEGSRTFTRLLLDVLEFQ